MSDPLSFFPPGPFPSACDACPIRPRARKFVPGFGDPRARLVVIGERPGPCEVGACRCRAGEHVFLRPFVGISGKHVRRALKIGEETDHDGVFVTNVRKCLVEEETTQEKQESIRFCVATYLDRERALLTETRVTVCVGEDALRAIAGRGDIEATHGSVWNLDEVTDGCQNLGRP